MAILLSVCLAQEEDDGGIFLGKCPALKNTIHHRGEQLDLKRLDGQWKLIYEDKEQIDGLDCITMKVVSDVEGGNSSQVQVFFGNKIPNAYEDPQTQEKVSPLVYQEGYITFSHPQQSNIGAPHSTLDELDENDKQNEADDEDDPYEHSYQILDTDYDNFLFFYQCQEQSEKVNSQGQTEYEVDQLKKQEPDKTHDTSFSSDLFIHHISVRVLTRSLKPEITTKAKIENWIQLLKNIVGEPQKGDYFKNFDIVEHYPYCPDESIDMFTLPEMKKQEQFMEEYYASMEVDHEGDDDIQEGDDDDDLSNLGIDLDSEDAEVGEEHDDL